MRISIFFIILLILLFLFFSIQYILYQKKIENFDNTKNSDFTYNLIMDNCNQTFIKDFYPNKFSTCKSSAFITQPEYLCQICGYDDKNPLYQFNHNGINYYGCSPNQSNQFGLQWNTNNKVIPKKVDQYLAKKLTCNFKNKQAKSHLYMYVYSDDYATITYNGGIIQSQNTSWNSLGQYFIENVKYGDQIHIESKNVCAPGRFCISYLWNGELYILDKNGFENCANIINYQTTGTTGWSNLWESYIPNMLPWMKNWISTEYVPNCDGHKSTIGSISFMIGNTKNIGSMTNDLVCWLGVNDKATVNLNNKQVFSQKLGSMDLFTVPNVKLGDILTVNGQNNSELGKVGGFGICYLWCGKLFTLHTNNKNFNSSVHLMKYTTSNCGTMNYTSTVGQPNMNYYSGNLLFINEWISSCSGKCSFSWTTKIGDINLPYWEFQPSLNKWYTITYGNVNKPTAIWSDLGIISSTSMSVSFWLNISTLNNWRNIFHVSNTNNNCCNNGDRVPAVWVCPNQAQIMIANGNTQNGNINLYPGLLTLHTNYYIVIVWNNTTLNVYKNGELQYNYTYSSPITSAKPNATFYMGDPWYSSQDGGVKIRNFKIYNDVLTQNDISNMYHNEMKNITS
jgi:hypothetical protein